MPAQRKAKVSLTVLSLFTAAMGGVAADARILPEHSLICDKESSLRQALHDGTARSGDPKTLRRDCSFNGTPVTVKRLSCSGFICKVEIENPAVNVKPIGYTLRSYEP